MVHIHDNDGFFIAPAPMHKSYKTAFYEALDQHDHEIMIPYKGLINRGLEIPFNIDNEGSDYTFRMIILYDHGLFARKHRTLKNRIEKTKTAFAELSSKLNKYKLKTKEAIEREATSLKKITHLIFLNSASKTIRS